MNYKRALIITPHPDDEILGAGGYIKKLSESGCEVNVLTVSGHLPPLYSEDFVTKGGFLACITLMLHPNVPRATQRMESHLPRR